MKKHGKEKACTISLEHIGVWFVALVGLWFVGCDDGVGPDGEAVEVSLHGAVQKGPFVVGSSIQVSLLGADLDPTGAVTTPRRSTTGASSRSPSPPRAPWPSRATVTTTTKSLGS